MTISPVIETNAPTVAQRLVDAFARHGVEFVFGQSLPSAFFLAARPAGLRQIAYRQENAGGAMADGYARLSGKVGVVAAQNGPAAALLVAPLAEALKASIPVIALVQDVTRGSVDRNGFQELDHIRLFEPVAKWVRRLDRASRIDDYVDMAIVAATSGRPGPAVLIVPADVLTEPAPRPSNRRTRLGHYPLDRPGADAQSVAQAVRILSEARHPLVVAGGGVHLSGAARELARLQDVMHLPVATTMMGKGAVDETHPLSLGVIGNSMGRGARANALKPMVARADVVLLVGNRTNQNGTDSWTLLPRQARFIHIDLDPQEIGRNYEALRLTGDARAVLEQMLAHADNADLAHREASRAAISTEIAAARAEWERVSAAVRAFDDHPVRPERLMHEIDRRMSADDIAVADASYASLWITGGLTARRSGQRFLTPRGIAGLGWGLPLAIGAQLARPRSRVVCVCGDGGFAHSWAELETLARLELPIVVTVLNNGILAYQKHAEQVLFADYTEACVLSYVDHAAIGNACGIASVRLTHGSDIAGALDNAFARRSPMLIEIMTDPDARPPINFYEGHFAEPFYDPHTANA